VEYVANAEHDGDNAAGRSRRQHRRGFERFVRIEWFVRIERFVRL